MGKTLLTSLVLGLLVYSGRTDGLCTVENGTIAICDDLEDVEHIDASNLETLKTSVGGSVLRAGRFTNFTNLKHLHLSRGAIERIEAGSFRELSNLRSLNLAENRLKALGSDSMDGLNHLHSLNLRRNDLAHLPAVLSRLKVLKYMDVQGNPLECDCATVRLKDLLLKRGVKMLGKASCAGPSSARGSSLVDQNATTVCHFERQDREMQNDQSAKDSSDQGDGSGDWFDKKSDDPDEYVETSSQVSQTGNEQGIETPFPSVSGASQAESKGTESLQESAGLAEETTPPNGASDSVGKGMEKNEEIFFDSGERKEQTFEDTKSTEKMKVYKDALFNPAEGSGDGDEGSGEGSGTGMIFGDWRKVGEVESTKENDEESSSAGGWFDMILQAFWSTTEAPNVTGDPELEEEQFIDASSVAKEVDEEIVVPKKIHSDETAASTTESPGGKVTTVGIELVDDGFRDTTKLENIKEDVPGESRNDELAEVSPAKQSKKGMGSYVVLAALLAILATLIGFAAYKGDFCRRKRKRGDIENGTELKDMQKALLETASLPQPKIASNGNVENAPLVTDASRSHEETKTADDRPFVDDARMSAYDVSDAIKPPRLSGPRNVEKDSTDQDVHVSREDSLSGRTNSMDQVIDGGTSSRLQEASGPPLSPGAQRVKITVQENPDSVPRTPILITRTMAGENLVKIE